MFQIGTLDQSEPWFVGKDVAVVLGYRIAHKVIYDHVDIEDKRVFQIGTPSGEQNMIVINESCLYCLILRRWSPKTGLHLMQH